MPKLVDEHRNRHQFVTGNFICIIYFFYICVCVDMKLVKCIFVITS